MVHGSWFIVHGKKEGKMLDVKLWMINADVVNGSWFIGKLRQIQK